MWSGCVYVDHAAKMVELIEVQFGMGGTGNRVLDSFTGRGTFCGGDTWAYPDMLIIVLGLVSVRHWP